MDPTLGWPWVHSLAMARAGQKLQVDQVLFAAVREYCGSRGIREGVRLLCQGQGEEWVDVVLPSGKIEKLPREYAWFVSVSPPISHG